MMNASKCCTIQKEKGPYNPSILGTYPKANSYAEDNQFCPEPETEPESPYQVIIYEPEDSLEHASMVVNFHDNYDQVHLTQSRETKSLEKHKLSHLLAIIESYFAYMVQNDYQYPPTEVNYKKLSSSLMKKLDKRFNFRGILLEKRLFPKSVFAECARYEVRIADRHSEENLQNICNKKLNMLSKMNEVVFLDKLRKGGYISKRA